MKVKIKKWGINGEGVGFVNKKAFFIENAIPEETVEAEVTNDHGTWMEGKTTEVLEPSPRRRHPMCPHWQECGGCSLMHVDYKGQVRMKEKVLADTLRKYCGYEGRILPLMKNPVPLAYRNALKLPFGLKDDHLVTGMYARNSNDFIPLDRCLIHEKKLEAARKQITEILDQKGYRPDTPEKPGLKTLVAKEFDGKIHVALITGPMEIDPETVDALLELPDVASVWQSIKEADSPNFELFGNHVTHLGGEMTMSLDLDGLSIDLLPRSFFQLNTEQAKNMYRLIASWIPEGNDFMVEAYSGAGAISLYSADRAKEILGIECVEDAVANAQSNAQINGKSNVRFICGDAGEEMQKIVKHRKIDTLVVDPPRSGLNSKMIDSVRVSQPETILYVSCNPATLAKNLDALMDLYDIEAVQPVDMFSQTSNIESVVRLRKKVHPDTNRIPMSEREKEKEQRPQRPAPRGRSFDKPSGRSPRKPGFQNRDRKPSGSLSNDRFSRSKDKPSFKKGGFNKNKD